MAPGNRNGGIKVMQGECKIETATCYTKHKLIIWNRQIRSFETLLDENVIVERAALVMCHKKFSGTLKMDECLISRRHACCTPKITLQLGCLSLLIDLPI